MSDGATNDPRVLFAAERTFLAWIRTGLALMGFGFVVARFGIFLQQIMLDRGFEPARSSGFSVVLGVCLVAIGVAVFLASAWRYMLLVRALGRGEALAIRPSTLAIALASVLAAVGLLMVLYLLYARGAAWSLTQKGQVVPTQSDSGVITPPGTRGDLFQGIVVEIMGGK